MGWFDLIFGKSPDYQAAAQSIADNTIDLFTLDQCIKQNELEKRNMSITDWKMQQDIQNDLKKERPLTDHINKVEQIKQTTLTYKTRDSYCLAAVKYQSTKTLVLEYSTEKGNMVEDTLNVESWSDYIFNVQSVKTKPALNNIVLNQLPETSLRFKELLKQRIYFALVSVKNQTIVGFVLQDSIVIEPSVKGK